MPLSFFVPFGPDRYSSQDGIIVGRVEPAWGMTASAASCPIAFWAAVNASCAESCGAQSIARTVCASSAETRKMRTPPPADLGNCRRFVPTEHKALPYAPKQLFGRISAGQPLGEVGVTDALSAFSYQDDDAAVTSGTGRVLQRLVCLVQVDVLGPAASAGQHNVGSPGKRHTVQLIHFAAALPVCLGHVASHRLHHALLAI